MKKFIFQVFITIVALPMCFAAQIAEAQNPTGARMFFRVTNTDQEGESLQAIGVDTRLRLNEPVPTGGSCEVELSLCGQPFVPASLNLNSDPRACNRVVLGEAEMAAGEEEIDFLMRTGPFGSLGRNIRAWQVSVQFEAVCTDADDNETTITPRPRARRITRVDGLGISAGRFINFLQKTLRVNSR